MLRARSIAVTDTERDLVLHTEDLATLKRWLPRTATATSAEELLQRP